MTKAEKAIGAYSEATGALVQEAWAGSEIMITFGSKDRVDLTILTTQPGGVEQVRTMGTKLEAYINALEVAP